MDESSSTSYEPKAKRRKNTGDSDIEPFEPDEVQVVIPSFQWEGKDCDIALCVEGLKYFTHSEVLTKNSPVLEEMLNGNWREKTDLLNIKLNESPVSQPVFKDFLKYFYTGEAPFTCSNLTGMLLLADKYNVKNLLELCDGYLSKVKDFDPTTLIHLMISLYDNHLTAKYDALKEHAVQNFETIFIKTGVPFLSPSILSDLLSSSSICIQSENCLFEFVDRWAQKLQLEINFTEGSRLTYEEEVTRVLDQVRFYFVTPEIAMKSKLGDRFDNYLMTKFWDVAKVKNGKNKIDLTNILYTCRSYTNAADKPMVKLRHTIENFSNFTRKARSYPAVTIQNNLWRIKVMPIGRSAGQTKRLGFFVECQTGQLFCHSDALFRILSQKEGIGPLDGKATHSFFNDRRGWGFGCFVDWNELLDESNGYIKDNSIILEVSLPSKSALQINTR